MRPPTDQKALDPLSVDPWPTWPVPDGDLTPHGATAAILMGLHYRTLYAGPGFIEPGTCPAPGDLFAWADKAERTKATANAILSGIFPGCGLQAGFDPKAADALFHPVAAGVAPLDEEVAKAGVLEAMGGSLQAAKTRYAADFASLAQVLHGPDRETCAKEGLGKVCKLIDLPWGIDTDKSKGRDLSLKGPLQMASTVAEVIRLEYSGGLPEAQVGWGRVKNAGDVKTLLSLHKAQYDVTLRTPYIAKRNASQLLHQIAVALQQGTDLPGATEAGPPPSKLLLLVGHDTNIATMQATLGVSWTLSGYPENDTPPAGALIFERLRDTQTGDRYVRLVYTAQTMDQIRRLTPPSTGAMPERAVLALPGCAPAPVPETCRLSDFVQTVQSRIDPTALAPVSWR
ncbi:histidine-type phosphatase [Microvirga lenta]|uniref:histidine-type phosphatase n=1 Tax=Microvirga lenta TaxID=2881337 RepID=UPI001CFDBD2A|nr:histidine-type phosphatase [Microvirga lenta]MCB5173768.1 histidine-type phosphatase [Microvirga lenta]